MTKPDALGMYIFAGGFTLGMQKHFNVRAHFEDGPFGTATVRRNLPHVDIYTDPAAWPLEDFVGVPVIFGNPPCAPWSTAGNLLNQTRKLENAGLGYKWQGDPRVECVRRQFALLEKLSPKIWAWESVAAAYTRGRAFIEDLAARAMDQGYAVTRVLVNGKFTGLPQERRRFFMVCHKVELPWYHPGQRPPTVGEVFAQHPDAAQPHTEATAKLTPELTEFIRDVQPGESAIKAFDRWVASTNRPVTLTKHGQLKGRPGFLRRRLDPNRVSGTVVAGDCLIHPEHDRYLTVKEAQLLSGYPSTYEFVGRDAYAQISKAVLPPVGEWLGDVFARGLQDHRVIDPMTWGRVIRDVSFLKPLGE